MATEVTSGKWQDKRSSALVLLTETPIKQLSMKNTFVRILTQNSGESSQVTHGANQTKQKSEKKYAVKG